MKEKGAKQVCMKIKSRISQTYSEKSLKKLPEQRIAPEENPIKLPKENSIKPPEETHIKAPEETPKNTENL